VLLPGSTETGAGPPTGGDTVELVLSPDRSLVRVARVTASGIASRLGFSWDEIEDLRLAVDELSHALLVQAKPAALLRLSFVSAPGSIEVQGQLDDAAGLPQFSAFADRILTALVNEHAIRTGPDGSAVVWLRKRRAG
jgi:serine/threonine-protein kinase RsbW